MNGANGGGPPGWHLDGPPGPYDEPTVTPGLPAPAPQPLPQSAPQPAPEPFPQRPPAAVPMQSFEPGTFVPEPMPRSGPMQLRPQAALGHPEISGHMLGISTLLVGVGGLLGIRFGGLYGGVAGTLFGGAAVNVYRAIVFSSEGTVEADREAVISGTYALVTGGVASYVAWKVDEKGAPRVAANPRQATLNAARSCQFRPVGP